MSTPVEQGKRSRTGFYLGFGLVALLIAGLVSYLADSDPDGLDSVTLEGCQEAGEELRGNCIAQQAGEHALGNSPLADYAVAGNEGLTGVAGVLGVLLTVLLAGGLFWLLRKRKSTSGSE